MAQRVTARDAWMVVLATVAIATSGPLAKEAAPLPPLAIAAGRCLLAACFLFALAPRKTLRALLSLSRGQALQVFAVGAVLALHFAAFLTGLANTSLAATMALVSLEPLTVVLAAWAMVGLRPRAGEFAGLFVAVLGALVVTLGVGDGDNRLWGDALVFVATLLYGVYVASARSLRDVLPAGPYASAVYAVSGALLLPCVLLERDACFSAPPRSWLLVVAIALIPTLIGHTLVQLAARRVPPSVVALISPGETVGAIALYALLGGKLPTRMEWVGAGLIVLGATSAVRSGARSDS